MLWWVPTGHIPTANEGVARIELLDRQGATPEAFTLRQFFDAPAPDKLARWTSAS